MSDLIYVYYRTVLLYYIQIVKELHTQFEDYYNYRNEIGKQVETVKNYKLQIK